MPKLRSLTPKKVIEILKRNGFELDRTTGSHYVFYNSKTNKRAVVAYHSKDLPRGTLSAILKQAGIPTDKI